VCNTVARCGKLATGDWMAIHARYFPLMQSVAGVLIHGCTTIDYRDGTWSGDSVEDDFASR